MQGFTFYTEKIANKGEDAPATYLDHTTRGIIAVYDGLGGAGSALYEIPNESVSHSGAYLASRLAKTTTERCFQDNQHLEGEEFIQFLELTLRENFEQEKIRLQIPHSRLKSKLLRTLPTTIAGIYWEISWGNEGNKMLDSYTFWAGDSRCFFLEKESLKQVSRDHLKGNPDALENLKQDATMLNCLHADEPIFDLELLQYKLEQPTVLICATDGCFGYIAHPIYFEYILLETLMNSNYTLEDWNENLKQVLLSITGDDMSFSLVAWGFEHLDAMKLYFHERYEIVKKDYIGTWITFKNNPHTQEQSEQFLQNLWKNYAQNYYI